MTEPRIIVLGDFMLDRYVTGEVERICPEAPVPVLRKTRTEERPGGAGAVCVDLAALGATVTAIGVVGKDEEGVRICELLEMAGVNSTRILPGSIDHSTVKTRYVCNGQQMLRVDQDAGSMACEQRNAIRTLLESQVPLYDALVICDHFKTLWNEVIKEGIEIAAAQNMPIVVDPSAKRKAARYAGPVVLCPNRRELEALVDCSYAWHVEALGLVGTLGLRGCVTTLDKEGVMVSIGGNDSPTMIAAEAHQVYDVTGAGDMVVAVLAYKLACGVDILEAARVANKAAGVEVTKLGATPLTWAEINGQTGE